MLTNLYVKNMALIDEADIDFESGLTVITGETGAGKSIILDSLAIALAMKNPGEMLRETDEPAIAQAGFYFSDKKVLGMLSEMLDTDIPDGELIIQRKILSGRSQFKINSINVNSAQVKEIAPVLLDLHAQRDNLRLLKEENQLEMVDYFCGEKFAADKKDLRDKYGEYQELKAKLQGLGEDEEVRLREADLLRFEVNELESAALKVGEDTELEGDFVKLQNHQKINEGLSDALGKLSYGNENVVDMIGAARKALSQISDYDGEIMNLNEMLGDAEGIISDSVRALSDYADGDDYSEEEFSRISQRLDLYNHLKTKFNADTERLLSILDEKKDRLSVLDDYDGAKEDIERRIADVEGGIKEICERITEQRVKTAKDLSEKIAAAAKDLNFNDVRFNIEIETSETFTSNGCDKAGFLISTNPGEALKPLNKVASGGELSRIMLAIKTVTAQADGIETLIFDEIDTGISGRTAQKTSEKMALIADERQIICITHLPQIAAMGDYHLLIEKHVEGKRSKTTVKRLSEEESVDELSRLLGGSEITESVILNAKEMKNMAKEYKSENRS